MARSELYVNGDNMKHLQELSEKRGVTKAAVLNELLTNVGLGKTDVKPIVLQVPKELLAKDKEGLRMWLEHKSSGIVDLFYPSE